MDVTAICCDDHRKCVGTLQGQKAKCLHVKTGDTQSFKVLALKFSSVRLQPVTTYHTDER